MEVLRFVIFWAAHARGLLGIALIGCRRRKASGRVSRGGRGWPYAAFAAGVVVFGAAIPIASSLGAKENSKEIARAGISDLTALQERGREVFSKYCALCHSLSASNAVAEVGPNLDQLKPALDRAKQQVINGGGIMPAFKGVLTDAQIDAVAKYVADQAGKSKK